MSDDERQAQSKFDPPAVSSAGLTRPIEAAPPVPDAATAEAPEPAEHAAQVKAVTPSVASPDRAPEPGSAATSNPEASPAARVLGIRASSVPPPAPPAPPPASMPAAPSAPTTAAPSVPVADVPVAGAPHEEEVDSEDEPALPVTIAARLRRLSPALVILAIGSIGSLVFLAFAVTSHTTPVPVLLSSAVVTGLAFAVDSAVASFSAWSAAKDGESGRALLLAVVGGITAVITSMALAGTVILILLLNG